MILDYKNFGGTMKPRQLINIMHMAEKLKDVPRHCYSSNGRRESVAEHCWRASLMAYFLSDEFPEADMDKVIKMILIHDLGEIFTGDIPVFNKTKEDEDYEQELLYQWVRTLPDSYCQEMISLYEEMNEQMTLEAKLFKVVDGLEAVIQHNESSLDTWLDNEYELNLTYADDRVQFSSYLKQLREEIRKDTLYKIENE